MKRLAILSAVCLVVAGVFAGAASAALFFLVKPNVATPGQRVEIRSAGTPWWFTYRRAKRPLRPPTLLYLVPNEIADDVATRFDPRLTFLGRIRLDRRGRGVKTFTVPRVRSDVYAIAFWCRDCGRRGRPGFTSFAVNQNVNRYFAPHMVLRIKAD